MDRARRTGQLPPALPRPPEGHGGRRAKLRRGCCGLHFFVGGRRTRQRPAGREVDMAHNHPAKSELPAVEYPFGCCRRRAAPVTVSLAGIAGGLLTPG